MDDRLAADRAPRWWQTRRPIGSLRRAGEFIDDVGFALLFPKARASLPSLWEAASDRPLSELAGDWGPDIQRVWGWKDELPLRRLAWYGKFLRGWPSFLSPALLADVYPREGRPGDFEDASISPDARRAAVILEKSGPLPSFLLRRAAAMEGKQGGARFSAALAELGRNLVVTHYGNEPVDSGWPSAVLELTARAFRVPSRGSREERDVRAADAFLDTMLEARHQDLARAFGWPGERARDALEELAGERRAVREGGLFRRAAEGKRGVRSGREGRSR